MSRIASPRQTSAPFGAVIVTSISGRRSLQPPSGITCAQKTRRSRGRIEEPCDRATRLPGTNWASRAAGFWAMDCLEVGNFMYYEGG